MTDRPDGVIPTEEDNRALREFIHEQIRIRSGTTPSSPAVGVDGSVVSRWIRDRKPEPALVRQMAECLGVDVEYLMTVVGYLEPRRSDISPEHAALIAKVRLTPLTKDRYPSLDALLEDWQRREP